MTNSGQYQEKYRSLVQWLLGWQICIGHDSHDHTELVMNNLIKYTCTIYVSYKKDRIKWLPLQNIYHLTDFKVNVMSLCADGSRCVSLRVDRVSGAQGGELCG